MGTENSLVPVQKTLYQFYKQEWKCILSFNEPHESYGLGLNQFLPQRGLKKEGLEKHKMINENA